MGYIFKEMPGGRFPVFYNPEEDEGYEDSIENEEDNSDCIIENDGSMCTKALLTNNNILCREEIYIKLEAITDDYSVIGNSRIRRLEIITALTAELFHDDNYNEVTIFNEILMSEYVPGNINIQGCYNKYLQEREERLKKLLIAGITNVLANRANEKKNENTGQSISNADCHPLKLETVIELIENITNSKFEQIKGRQILFDGRHPKGYQMILFAPKSRFYEQYGLWWIDLNMSQRKIIEKYKDAFVLMRLEYDKFCCFYWSEIEEYLIDEHKIHDRKSGELWRMYINKKCINILGNEKRFNITVHSAFDMKRIVLDKLME